MLIPYKIFFYLSPVYKQGALGIWVVDEDRTLENASNVLITGDSRLNGTYPIGQVIYSNHPELPANSALVYTEEGIFNQDYADAFGQRGSEPFEVISLQVQAQGSSAPDINVIDGATKPGTASSDNELSDDDEDGMEMPSWGWAVIIGVGLGLLYWYYTKKKG